MTSRTAHLARTHALPIALAAAGFALCATTHATTIAHWRFEEGPLGDIATAAILDSSGNGHNGTPVGGITYTDNTPNGNVPQTGSPNAFALDFDGATTTRVFIEDDPDFHLTESFTLEAFINLAALPPNGFQWQILFRGDSRGGIDPYYLDLWDGEIRFTINSETADWARVTTTAPALNTWTHIAGVLNHDTSTMSLYLDGLLVDTVHTDVRAFATLNPALSPGLSIGGYPDNHYGPYQGLIDEVRISITALSPDEFLNAAAPIPEPATMLLLGIGVLGLVARRRAG